MTNETSCALPGNHLSSLCSPEMREKLVKFIFHKKKSKIPVDLTFQQNLQEHHFVDAGKQLIDRENRLFVLKQEGIGAMKKKLLEEEEDSEAKLVKDYDDWLKLVMGTLENSLKLNSAEEQEILKEAVQAILQEEEQDVQWEGFKETERPPWRPRRCKQKHEALLQTLVQSRMQHAPLDSSVEAHSSVKNYIFCKGKQLREDLLKVVTCVSSCYPEQDNVCQLYATLYHKSFSDTLRKVANYGLCDDDCIVLLSWVNNHYHYILNDSRIKEVIDCTQLGPLLPEDIINPLEQQFLTTNENELSTWLHGALNREESAWQEGKIELIDQKYSCHLHIDVIQCFDSSVRSAQEVLGDETKARRVSCQMSNFLTDYKTFHDKVIKEKQTNSEAVLMANLWCISQFRDYIIRKAHLFPEEVKTNCLSLLNAMRDSSHAYFTYHFHKDLKELYKKLGSSKWLRDSEGICEELLAKVEEHIQKFKHLHDRCCQELIGDLHKGFLAEYVRKMMKNKIRFADKEKQEKAAEAVCKNSDSIHARLTAGGSNMDWLKDILPKLAGLLKLQHPDSIKLELCDLLRDYPDFSKHHVTAWLSLKSNLSASELKQILNSVTISLNQLKEEQESIQCSKNFFSFVRIK
ncbi:tumor necrosis factor alpha-induced protein 2 isoform X2 [Triplophysa dalaica]|uniref:tumor necrosis factor alpha-induced protein 2 isoform X2 n=1 Tax=Triplophysa dalaica TaxID=1582913 RepID=UPI0024DFC787|nr:tumor necrosis factor alpha-induced protein 2 isoform X2 [Triplophysa dalaica]